MYIKKIIETLQRNITKDRLPAVFLYKLDKNLIYSSFLECHKQIGQYRYQRNRDDGSLQEYDEQMSYVYRYSGLQYDQAYFCHVDDLQQGRAAPR